MVRRPWRGGHHAPDREVGAVLAVRHLIIDAVHRDAVADFQHVRVVPVAGAGVLPQGLVLVDDLEHALGLPAAASVFVIGRLHGQESGADVARGPPGVADVRGPFPGLAGAPFADAEENGPSGPSQGVAHQGVGALGVDVVGEAPVVFQIIHAPVGIGDGVLVFVAEAARVAGAGEVAGVAVDAQFQAPRVQVVRERLHPGRELHGVFVHESILVPLAVPAVIQVQVHVAGVHEAEFHHRVGGGLDQVFVDVGHEAVPGTPAHLRRVGDARPFREVGGQAARLCQGDLQRQQQRCQEDADR